MSIATEITRIAKNVSDSLDAVAAKGVTVPSGSTSDDLPDLIASIQIVHYYTGSSAPASSLGANGDIYLQTGG